MDSRRPPLAVEATRGTEIESTHLVDAVVVDADGNLVEHWGDPHRPVLPRSAIKPIQALPLVETGAAEHFGLTDVELAMACSSHSGEPGHIETIEAWLATIGVDEISLECGSHPPVHEPSAAELVRTGVTPGPRHNNCSGKHTGFLTVCRHLGYPVAGYIRPDHPIQTGYITPTIEEMCRLELAGQVPAIDGCGIPVWTFELSVLAGGWARLPDRPAGKTLLDAMRAQPFHVAGSDRSCTLIMESAGGAVAVKTGAEGVYCGVVPDTGHGIALKVRDGDGGHRASGAAISWVLHRLGLLDTDGREPLTNWAGTTVGELRVRD